MSSVREAAERFRNNVHITTEDFRITKEALRDYVTIKNAYLAEHQPDDGESLTLADNWVEEQNDVNFLHKYFLIGNCFAFTRKEYQGLVYLPHITTRGQVRQLLKLLEGN